MWSGWISGRWLTSRHPRLPVAAPGSVSRGGAAVTVRKVWSSRGYILLQLPCHYRITITITTACTVQCSTSTHAGCHVDTGENMINCNVPYSVTSSLLSTPRDTLFTLTGKCSPKSNVTVLKCFFLGNGAITSSFCVDPPIVPLHLNVSTFCMISLYLRWVYNSNNGRRTRVSVW